MKRTLVIAGTTVILLLSLVMQATAKPIPTSAPSLFGFGIQPYWLLANEAEMTLTVGSNAKATIEYDIPSGASAQCRISIEQRAPGGSWRTVKTSSSATASCSATRGYQYKAEGTLTITLNGKREVIEFSDGPYTA